MVLFIRLEEDDSIGRHLGIMKKNTSGKGDVLHSNTKPMEFKFLKRNLHGNMGKKLERKLMGTVRVSRSPTHQRQCDWLEDLVVMS